MSSRLLHTRRLSVTIVCVALGFFLLVTIPTRTANAAGLGMDATLDRVTYQLGSSGVVIVNLRPTGRAIELLSTNVYFQCLYSDGRIWHINTTPQTIGANYDSNPIHCAADIVTPISYSFQLSSDDRIVSGYFYYILFISYRWTGDTAFQQFDTSFVIATDTQNNNCVVSNPSRPSYPSLVSSQSSLQTSYDSLNTYYNALQSQYNNLQSQYSSLLAQQGSLPSYLTYGFGAAMIVLLFTTIYFATRPRMKL